MYDDFYINGTSLRSKVLRAVEMTIEMYNIHKKKKKNIFRNVAMKRTKSIIASKRNS